MPEHFPIGMFSRVSKSKLTNNPDDGMYYLPTIQSLTKKRLIPNSNNEYDPISAKELPSHYIVFRGPQAACVSDNGKGDKLQSSTLKSFIEVVPTIQLIAN
jgi:hypothetical protein